ncbi:MAG: hypothetical protein NTZ13_00415 [Candidatus Parcubacteria bacterium]|nr:hypothetical protein [Candidatus Parcubacteria bacterium]
MEKRKNVLLLGAVYIAFVVWFSVAYVHAETSDTFIHISSYLK